MEDIGHGKAAIELGVDRKTLWRSMNGGRLTPRLAEALERRALFGADRTPFASGERVDAIERSLQALDEEVARGRRGRAQGGQGTGSAQAGALRAWEQRLSEAELREHVRDGDEAKTVAPVQGITQPAKRRRQATGPRRYHPNS